jgi:UDP-2-acetamido-2-deoxy-ribo-hexuluronate aminotransferase
MIKRVKSFWKDNWCDNLNNYMRKYDFWEVGITEELESEILKMKPRKHALVVDSTSNAIWMCLYMWSKRYPERDEVMFPNWGYPATFKACKVLGLKPVPIDMRMDTLGMNEYGIKTAVNDKTLAVVHIETNGVVGNPQTIKNFVPKEVLFIEDSAPSILQAQAGMFGDVSMFSFSPTKPFCVGQGSVILTDNTDIYDYLKQLRHTPNYEDKSPTLNFMLSPYLIALLLPQLKYWDYLMNRRTLTHIYYRRQLDIFKEPMIVTDAHGSIMYFAKNPESVSDHLSLANIEHRYHGYPCYSEIKNKFPVSHYIRHHLIDLPIHNELTEENIYHICQIVKEGENA